MTTMFQRGVSLTLVMLMVSSIGALGSSETTPGNNEESIEKLTTSIAGLQEKITALEAKHVKKADKVQIPGKGQRNRRTPGRKLEEEAAPLTPAEQAAANTETIAGLVTCLDYMWLLVSGALVMFMQAGFAILESGSCRQKNASVLLLKNMMDACLGTLVWYFLGYGIAYGLPEEPNAYVGVNSFAGSGFLETDEEGGITGTGHFKDWFFQWAFCATAATIVSGGVAERMQFTAYVIYSVIMTGIIYPFIVYWTWSGSGFLTEMGYSDFAGSGIVHLTGGIGALVGAVMVGPRAGRWAEEDSGRFDPHNMTLVVLGTFILWFGWYGFNCGSTLGFGDVGTATTGALVAMNTTIAAATGGLTAFLLRLRTGKKDLAGMCNGVLAGLVAVCAGVGAVDPGMALLIGAFGGAAMEGGHVLLQKLKIDDPLDAFPVHGCAGIIGCLLRPLLDRGGVQGEMMTAHIVGILVIIGWTGILSLIVFGGMKAAGQLRISDEVQELGADHSEMAQVAYRGNSKDKGNQ